MVKEIKKKNSAFELLKILAMLKIIGNHLIAHNAFNVDTDIIGLTFNKVFFQFIGNGFIGSNLFFMISAWFLCTKTDPFEFKDGGAWKNLLCFIR